MIGWRDGNEATAKNIVILFDGTSNEISSNRPNILRLFGCLAKIVMGDNPKKACVQPDPKGASHDSKNFLWGLIEFIPRRVPRQDRGWRRSFLGLYIPMFRRRRLVDGSVPHRSVVERGALAPNVPQDHRVEG